jgi:hypothetical protein
MILLLFFLSLLLQVILYLLLDKTKYGKPIVLAILLLLHLWLLPGLLIPDVAQTEEKYTCGMMHTVAYLLFWILGGGLTFLTHICYCVIRSVLK